MIVKVQGETGNWILFDNAEKVEFSTTPRKFHSIEEIDAVGVDEEASHVHYILTEPCHEGMDFENPVEAAIISFTQNHKKHIIIFNTVAYLCNDQGKTIERVIIK